ncbi:RNA polymerase sigma factor [Candidatus Nitrospira bockiana]
MIRPINETVGEADLLKRSLQGDREAFGLLLERHAAPAFNIIARMVGSRTDAEDLFQEACLAAFRALPAFRADSKFSTWLYRIAVNKSKDWLRAHRAGVAPIEEPGEEETSVGPVEERTPETALSQKEIADHLDEAIQRLPVLYREAFLLKHVEGFSYEDMSEILGVNPDALKMRVYKARVQLRRDLHAWRAQL